MPEPDRPQSLYRRCEPAIPVDVEHNGGWWRGEALASSGQRVTVRFSVEAGAQHQLVVDAIHVRRSRSAQKL